MDGAQMHLGDARKMRTRARAGRASPAQAGHGTRMLTIFIDDVDAHYVRVKSLCARIVEEPNETMYANDNTESRISTTTGGCSSQHTRDIRPYEGGG
jgi:hypothetical protein